MIAACVAVVILAFRLCGGPDGDAQRTDRSAPTREITPAQLLHLAANDDQPLRLRTTCDVIPGGLSAAMAPMLVDWNASEIDGGDGFVVVHNINYGGNPVEGTTVLQSARIPLDGVAQVEWVLVPLGPGGRRALIHHGQLRFVFREDRPVELLDLTSAKGGGDRQLRDLVFSWEAWRAPGIDYEVRRGMDPGVYDLSLRVYAGPQRFLEDGLAGRDWYCTPLRLPGGDEGLAEALKVALALGDGIARHTISGTFSEAAQACLADAPVADRDQLADQWRRLRDLAAPRQVSRDPRLNPPADERGYQSVLRSCASVAYYGLLVAVDRLAERGLDDGVDFRHLDEPHLGGDEPWMKEIAETNLGGLFLRAPQALGWLRRHPYALPEKIPGRLDRAGLVPHRDGKPVEIHYSLGGDTPYGTLAGNLIR